jgi:hypothetical protein
MVCTVPFKVVTSLLYASARGFVTRSTLEPMRFASIRSAGEARLRYKHEKYSCILIYFVSSHHARVR